MEFLELMKKRESVRAFKEEPVSREDLLKIAEAGRLSPSGCNAQPWKFIIVDEPEAKAKLCDALVADGGQTGAPWRDKVPAFIVLVEQKANTVPSITEVYGTPQRFAAGDIGMAAMNMCYEAVDLGLATCMIGISSQKKMEENLGVPAGAEVRLTIAVGYPKLDKEPKEKDRKPLDEVVCLNYFA